MEVVDAVVIGAGPNGLVAGILLADAGWDVLVLEAALEPGGAVRSAELVEPGFTNDVCSAFYPFAPPGPIGHLGLEDHGLRWLTAPLVLAHPALDGTCPVLSSDRDATAASLDALQPGDGAAWTTLHDGWRRVRGPLLQALLGPFPPLRAGRELGWAAGRDALRLARFTLLPARRMGEELFAGEAARRLLAGVALHADYGPETPPGGFFGWLMLMLGQDQGWPVPEGGAGAITAALVRRLEAAGGRVRCGCRIERVGLRSGAATSVTGADGRQVVARRAVLADVDAPSLYHDLVGDEHLPARFVEDLSRFQWDHGTVKVDWTLDAPAPWAAPEARRAGTVHLAKDVDALTVQHAELAQGLLPAHPFLLVGQQSMTDPSRQPPGCETMWAYTHVPQRRRGDACGELDPTLKRSALEGFADRMEAEVEALAPGFRASVRGRSIAGPADLEDHDANLVGGALSGGTSQLHQMLVFRPTPGWGRPETPVSRLYLASASAHPGGAVHGSPGANAARAALWHDRAHPWRRLL